MRKLLAFLCICVQIVPSWGQSVLRTPNGVKVETETTCIELECFFFFYHPREEISSRKDT